MKFADLPFIQMSAYAWIFLFLFWLYAGLNTKMTIRKQSSGSNWIHVLLVGISFGLIYWRDTAWGPLAQRFLPVIPLVGLAGLCVQTAGNLFAIIAREYLGRNWSATVTVKKDHELVTNGPYAITRHPIYTGFIFGLAGSAIILGELRGILGLFLFAIAIEIKMAKEEEFMKVTFPQYDAYKQRTRKLIPFIY